MRFDHIGRPLLSLVLLLWLAAPAGPPLAAQAPAAERQCSIDWVGQEAELEAYMTSAEIAKMEDVPIGVTKPRRAVFEPGGPVARAAWKALSPSVRGGFRESYKAEMAAYVLDRILELRMVPPVVERRIGRDTGALIYWVENIKGWDEKNPPKGPEPNWSKQISRMKAFDLLSANIDRNAGNILYDDDWHIILIDHSRAFTSRRDLRNMAPLTRIERDLWARIEALTIDSLQAGGLGQWLSDGEMRALITRRDRMREEIAKLVKTNGEAAVFYD